MQRLLRRETRSDWFEIPVKDMGRVRRFYESLFDPKIELTRGRIQGWHGFPCIRVLQEQRVR